MDESSTEEQPSEYLPLLEPPPSLDLLAASLDRLEALFTPPDVVIDLTDSTPSDNSALDEFESQFSRRWIERVVALAMKAFRSGSGSVAAEAQAQDWEALVDRSATLLAALAGHCSAGPISRTFILPSPLQLPPPFAPTLSAPSTPIPIVLSTLALTIRDTTLLSASTGFRTWGSAPLLARHISLSPSSFFPTSPPHHTPLHVLELGSGTGLVGLTCAAVLHRLGQANDVRLTDFDDAALDNLRFNLRANASAVGGGRTTTVAKLDWADFVPSSEAEGEGEGERAYDIIFAADVVYEPSHVSLVHATIAALLRFPSPGAVPPACHLVLPLRPTHVTEHTAFDRLFPSNREGGTGEERCEKSDTEARHWRLVAKERREESATDGFGKRGDDREAKYWIYRIEWERVG